MMATLEATFASAPLWIIGAAFFLLLFAISWSATWLRRIIERNRETDLASDGYLLSAALALLGLLIAFTFSLALNLYDTRRMMVVEEGNAISTAWLRATLAEGREGEQLRQSIKSYTDVRLSLPEADSP